MSGKSRNFQCNRTSRSVGVISASSRSSSAAAVNGSPKCRVSFGTTATDTTYTFFQNVLVVVDHFTRYVQAFVTKNHTARTMAWVLYNNYFSVFGFAQSLMSDQGTEFCGKVIAAMCSLLSVEKICTTPYHPQTNGSAERVHQTLQRMIGKLDPEKRRK